MPPSLRSLSTDLNRLRQKGKGTSSSQVRERSTSQGGKG